MISRNCPACGAPRIRVVGAHYPDDLYRCDACGVVFFGRKPEEGELIQHYSDYPVIGKAPEITRQRYREVLSFLEPYRRSNRILDIGCGEGFFLREAKNKGWEVHGTEFAERYLPICRENGIEMHQGRLNAGNYQAASFDVILWIEVIEHIDYPEEELKRIWTLLRPGGVVYVTTPNFNSISRTVLKGKWTVIDYPGHLMYYTPDSLKKLFERNGFSNITVRTDGISIGRLKDAFRKRPAAQGDFHDVDRDWQAYFERSPFRRKMKAAANLMLNATGTGDNLKALFRKPETATS